MSKKITYASDKGGYQTKVLIRSGLIYLGLIILTLICLTPIWILVVNSTRQHNEIINNGLSLLPKNYLFKNFETLRTNSLYTSFFHPLIGMRNSLFIAGCCCAKDSYQLVKFT